MNDLKRIFIKQEVIAYMRYVFGHFKAYFVCKTNLTIITIQSVPA